MEHVRMTHRALFVAAVLALGSTLPLAGQQPSPDPGRWEQTIQAWEAEDRTTPPPEGAIVFVGSSSIRLWTTVREDMSPLTVIHRGFGGSWMHDAVHYADRIVTSYNPRAVVLYEGDNDVGGGSVSPEDLLAGFKAFVARVHATRPQARVYFLAIKPSLLRWDNWAAMNRANMLVKAETETSDLLTYVDVATPMLGADGKPPRDLFVQDLLHMTPKGYAIWTSVVRPVLMDREGGRER
jgi:lysophospholipase L1-like esterase